MKRIVGWLEEYLPRFKSLNLPDASRESESASPDEIDLGIDLPKEIRDLVNDVPLPDVGAPKSIAESATDARTPKMHTDEYVNTVPNLKILDESPPATDESTGFNPYDTGTLQIK